MVRIIPVSLEMLSYLLKKDDKDIILMSDDFYFSTFPESIKLGKKQKLQDLADKNDSVIYEFCAGPSTRWSNFNGGYNVGRSNSLEKIQEEGIHAFFVVKNEKELEDRFAVIDVVNS